jgi:hypothetical protein
METRIKTLLVGAIAVLLAACGGEPSSDPEAGSSASKTNGPSVSIPGASVFIITPTNGETVTSPLNVKFGVSGITIKPAGELAANSGHHHLLIDTDLADESRAVPSDDQHLHFGKGQTETTIELTPGTHTLQLVLGDGSHIPHKPAIMSGKITITVE